jgi:hypothetical protein
VSHGLTQRKKTAFSRQEAWTETLLSLDGKMIERKRQFLCILSGKHWIHDLGWAATEQNKKTINVVFSSFLLFFPISEHYLYFFFKKATKMRQKRQKEPPTPVPDNIFIFLFY